MAANKRKRVVSTEELIELQAERWAAETVGVKWQDRGPPGPDRGGASEWRGQQWRAGTNGGKQRFANRGGANKEYYTELYKAKAAGPANLDSGPKTRCGLKNQVACQYEFFAHLQQHRKRLHYRLLNSVGKL